MLVSFFQKIGQPLRWLRRKSPLLQDGNRPNDGPPDLDQLWRDFNKRLNSWLGAGNNGSGPGNSNKNTDGPGNMKSAGIGMGVIAIIIAFFWLLSGFFIVQEGQTAIVMTFGKYSHATHAGSIGAALILSNRMKLSMFRKCARSKWVIAILPKTKNRMKP
jgi:membrane protease subunit HflK